MRDKGFGKGIGPKGRYLLKEKNVLTVEMTRFKEVNKKTKLNKKKPNNLFFHQNKISVTPKDMVN